MLILTRSIQETIIIGDNIRMTVLDVRGGQVRFGIDAPQSVSIHREEIYNRIKDQGGNPSQTLKLKTRSAL